MYQFLKKQYILNIISEIKQKYNSVISSLN